MESYLDGTGYIILMVTSIQKWKTGFSGGIYTKLSILVSQLDSEKKFKFQTLLNMFDNELTNLSCLNLAKMISWELLFWWKSSYNTLVWYLVCLWELSEPSCANSGFSALAFTAEMSSSQIRAGANKLDNGRYYFANFHCSEKNFTACNGNSIQIKTQKW